VLLVTFISLGIRTGMVVALSIPLVLAATFLGMSLLNVGLHKVSLGALILALGLLVDDAIIAVEMMWVKMEQGWERTRAASFAYQHGRADAVRHAGHRPASSPSRWPSRPPANTPSPSSRSTRRPAHFMAGRRHRHSLAGLQAAARSAGTHPAPWPGKRRASPG
jgi:hypothetical protein